MNLLTAILPGSQAAGDSQGGRAAAGGDLPFTGSKSGARPRALRGNQRLLKYVLAVGLCLLAVAAVFGTIWIVAVTAAKHATAALMQNPSLLALKPRPAEGYAARAAALRPLLTPPTAQASPDPHVTGLGLPSLNPPPPGRPSSLVSLPPSSPETPTCTRRTGFFDCLELYRAPASCASSSFSSPSACATGCVCGGAPGRVFEGGGRRAAGVGCWILPLSLFRQTASPSLACRRGASRASSIRRAAPRH